MNLATLASPPTSNSAENSSGISGSFVEIGKKRDLEDEDYFCSSTTTTHQHSPRKIFKRHTSSMVNEKLNCVKVENNLNNVDINEIRSNVQKILETVEKAFPFTKIGNNRDDYSFFRVRPHLQDLKKFISRVNLKFTAFLQLDTQFITIKSTLRTCDIVDNDDDDDDGSTQIETWKLIFDYLEFVSDATSQLPEFDRPEFNMYKTDICRNISTLYSSTIAHLKISDLVPRNVHEIESCGKYLAKQANKFPEIYAQLLKQLQDKVDGKN